MSGRLASLKALAAGQASPVSLTRACLEAIEARNGALNLIVHLDAAGALEAAAAAQARRAAGAPLSPIDGAPLVIKANIAVAGWPWTAALALFAQRVAARDAEIVARLRAAGAVLLGLANMHEAAFGATTTSPLYGPAFHPARLGYTPGGSSGGSAAAVAAGFCLGALGTDTMGSVRLPSAYCGVAGMKPSGGRVWLSGVEPLSPTLDHVGAHARDAHDLALLMAALETRETGAPPGVGLAGLRVGRVAHGVALEPGVAARFEAACAAFVAAGARVEEAALDGAAFAQLRLHGLLICEAEAGRALAGPRALRPQGVSASLAALLDYGLSVAPARLAEAYAACAHAAEAAQAAFEAFDVLILPTAPHTAFPHSAPAPPSQADLTVFANMAGIPALSLPMGCDAQGLPAGLQILAPQGADARALAVAAAIEPWLNASV